ncbi:hypothetical protein DSECCO2_489160 [anaerobic digester metagenome]
MTPVEGMYAIAEEQGYDIDDFRLNHTESLSACLPDGRCTIAIDRAKLKGQLDELVKLAHEIGHCETRSFYNDKSPADVRGRHEERANRWMYRQLVPREELFCLLEEQRDLYEIAEYFGVTEEVVTAAYEYYRIVPTDEPKQPAVEKLTVPTAEPIKQQPITLESYFEQGLMFMSVEEFKQYKEASRRRLAARRSIAQQKLPSGYVRNRAGHIVCIDIWK